MRSPGDEADLFAVQIEDWKHLSFPVPVDEEEGEREREEDQDAD